MPRAVCAARGHFVPTLVHSTPAGGGKGFPARCSRVSSRRGSPVDTPRETLGVAGRAYAVGPHRGVRRASGRPSSFGPTAKPIPLLAIRRGASGKLLTRPAREVFENGRRLWTGCLLGSRAEEDLTVFPQRRVVRTSREAPCAVSAVGSHSALRSE